MVRALGDISGTTHDPQIHAVAVGGANRIVASCADQGVSRRPLPSEESARLWP